MVATPGWFNLKTTGLHGNNLTHYSSIFTCTGVSLYFRFSAQGEHELSGNEDPSILHAYVAYLPSKMAYKEGQSEAL